MKMPHATKADVCLFLEGSYPYVSGGVSSWTHELIKMQHHLTFHIVALVGANADRTMRFELPANVVGMDTIVLQKLPKGEKNLPKKECKLLFEALKEPLLKVQQRASLKDLDTIIKALTPLKSQLGSEVLFYSYPAWEMLLSMYNTTMPETSFLDYFWSWLTLYGGLYSVLLAPLPEADIYHALCTGYAGLFLARAKLETNKPCLITEHGIYTNERRIEIASADWLEDQKSLSMTVNKTVFERELKDFWMDVFSSYSRLCYQASSQIITLYEGNQAFQIMDGADLSKLRIIPNGIDYDLFSGIQKNSHPYPTVALIGRVVPIKDVKTFMRAVILLRERITNIQAFVIGPTDEDPEYYAECLEIVVHEKLGDTLTFTGKMNLQECLQDIDIMVLSSISEAQPLVILEAGAAGIPVVATDVGACHEMVIGRMDETPNLGEGGIITPLANAGAIADAIYVLLSNPDYYKSCSHSMQERVRKYYNKKDQYSAYASLYGSLSPKTRLIIPGKEDCQKEGGEQRLRDKKWQA